MDNMEKSEEMLKKALGINESYTEARHELGRLYLMTGRSMEAKKQFALALEHQPNDSLALDKMALIERMTLAKK